MPRPDVERSASGRRLAEFLGSFACVFAGLALLHGIGPLYTRAHVALGNALLGSARFASGVVLRFADTDAELAAQPWHALLHVTRMPLASSFVIPIDVRSLLFLPTAAYLALAIAVPLPSLKAHALLIACGLLILEPLLLVLTALPLLSFLGGTGPAQAFTLSRPMHVVIQIAYRALVAPPGMAFAVPLLVWWALLATLLRRETRWSNEVRNSRPRSVHRSP